MLVGPGDDVRAAVDRRAVREAKDRELLLTAQLFEFWPASGGEQAEKNTSSGDELVELRDGSLRRNPVVGQGRVTSRIVIARMTAQGGGKSSIAAFRANSQDLTRRLRATIGRRRRDLQLLWGLRGVRPRVLWFQWRARQFAWRNGDLFSIYSVTRPGDMRVLLELAAGSSRIVELGTGTAWTAITLALDDPNRRVVTYDIPDLSRGIGPQHYLQLVDSDVRDRIELIVAPGSTGPRDAKPVDLLYIDSSHEREQTIEEVQVWRPHLRPGAPVIFDDYTNPGFPGVREATEQLGLRGEQRGELFVHRHPG